MSVGPISGSAIPVSLPAGKTVFWVVTVQASFVQQVKLIDPTGNSVFEVSGASAGGNSPTQIGEGSFVADADQSYTLQMTYGSNQPSSVVWDEMPLLFNGEIVLSNLNYISEDATDKDFNDSNVSLTWFNRIG